MTKNLKKMVVIAKKIQSNFTKEPKKRQKEYN